MSVKIAAAGSGTWAVEPNPLPYDLFRKLRPPDVEILVVDYAVAVPIRPQIGRRANRTAPHNIVGRVDYVIAVEVTGMNG